MKPLWMLVNLQVIGVLTSDENERICSEYVDCVIPFY